MVKVLEPNFPLRHPLWAPMLVGLVLRLVAALCGYGWFAADDYFYVVEPAWDYLEDPGSSFPSGYRSQLVARGVFVAMAVARALSLEEPTALLRFAYATLGLWSLLAIPGVYLLTRRALGEEAARVAAWLMAVFAIVPRISTRALLGVTAIPALVWGLRAIDQARCARSRQAITYAFGAGVLLGLAAMIRFQLGVVCLAMVGWLLWPSRGSGACPEVPSRYRLFSGFVGGGGVAVLAQTVLDMASGRAPMETVWAYLAFNWDRASGFGVSPWYTYLLQLLALTIPPATFLLLRPMGKAAKIHGCVSVAFLAFVVVHSLIGHKEDRFLFPMLPLLFVLLGSALSELARGGVWQRRARLYFWGVNAVVLLFATLSDGQRSLTVPLGVIQAAGGEPQVAVGGAARLPRLYLGRGAKVAAFRQHGALLEAVERQELRPDYILWRPPPAAGTYDALARAGLHCGDPTVYQGDLVDRLLLWANSRHNRRRRPVAMVRCEGGMVLSRQRRSSAPAP